MCFASLNSQDLNLGAFLLIPIEQGAVRGVTVLPVVQREHLAADRAHVRQILPGLRGGRGRGHARAARGLLRLGGRAGAGGGVAGVEQHLLQRGEGEVGGVEPVLDGERLLRVRGLQVARGEVQRAVQQRPVLLLLGAGVQLPALATLLGFLLLGAVPALGLRLGVGVGGLGLAAVLLEVHLAQQVGLEHVLLVAGEQRGGGGRARPGDTC